MVTDVQVGLLRQKRMENKSMETAAATAGMSVRSAQKWQEGQLPSETKKARDWLTRPDAFSAVWASVIVPFLVADKRGVLRLIASAEGRDGSVTIHQDASIYAGLFDGVERAVHAIASGRRAYVHVVIGTVSLNGMVLGAGDALKANGVSSIEIERGAGAEVLLFDLP